MLDGNEKILCAVPSKDIISLYQNLNYHQADTLEGSLVLSEKYTSILNNVRYFAISDRESNHNFYLYRKTLVQVQNHEIAINGQGAFWDEMQGAYIKDKRPNQVTPADTIKLILGYSRWNVDYVDQMLEEESLRRDMNFYYVSLLDALNTVYQTWQVDIEPYINIEGHQITRRYVKLYQQQGGNNGRRFVYGDNALTVTQQANEGSIFTALVGRGAGVEETDADGNLTGGYSRKINFADVEWSKANGDPCDKPKGQEYVEWKESTELYGYSDGKPRIGIVNFDNEKDPAQLLKETWAQLQQVGVPLVQFKATVGDVGYLNLGETVTIVRYDLNIKYQTRVTGIKWNRCDEAKSQITIGVKAIQSTADKIAGLQQSVAQANVNADEAKSTANHAIIDGTGAVVNYGPNEPANPKEGDIWYDVQPDGTVVLKQYQNGQWVILIDDTTGQQIKNKVEAQQKELDKAVQDANAASAKADGLVAQVGDANTNAQKALTTAQQNQADLAQAKNDLENTKNQLTNVQSDLTGTKSSLAGAISNISQAQEDLKNTEQGLQGVKSDLANTKQSLANDEKNLTNLSEQAKAQGQSIVNIHNTQAGLAADIADVKGNVSSLQDTANGLQATVGTLNSDNLISNSDCLTDTPGVAPDTDWKPAWDWLYSDGNIPGRANWYGYSALQLNRQLSSNWAVFSAPVKSGKPSQDTDYAFNMKFYITTAATYDAFLECGYTKEFKSLKDIKLGTLPVDNTGSWQSFQAVCTVPKGYSWVRLKITSSISDPYFWIAQPMLSYGTTQKPYVSSNYPAQKMTSISETVDGIKATVIDNANGISQIKQTAQSIQSNVANNKSDISSIKQTADSLKSSIQDDEKNISSLQQTAQGLQGSISDNKNDIANIKATAQGLQTSVEDNKKNISTVQQQASSLESAISVTNSDNLVVNSDCFTSAKGVAPNTDWKPAWGWRYSSGKDIGRANWYGYSALQINQIPAEGYVCSQGIKAGNPGSETAYAISLKYLIQQQGVRYWVNVQADYDESFSNPVYYDLGNATSVDGNNYQTFTATVTIPAETPWIRLIIGCEQDNGYIWIAQPMVVYGSTVPTQYISSNQPGQKMSSIKQTIDSIQSTVQDNSGQISQLKQTSDSLTSLIGNANNDISSLKQRADSMETNISNNQNDISSLKQTANSLQSNIQSKADISQITQLSNAIQSVVQNVGTIFPNGDFADSNIQAYWSPWDITKDYTNITFDAQTYNGSFGNLLLHASGGGWTKAISTEYIPVQPNKSVTVSLASRGDWYGSNGKPQTLQCYVHFYDSKKNETENGHFDLNCSNNQQWYDNSTTYDCNSNECYIRIEIVLQGNQENWAHITNVKVSSDGGESISSKISQMADDINLRVQKGDLLSQINIQAGSTLIQSNKLYLDASSVVFSGNAFIPSAAITDLSADKITAGTLNAYKVNVINLDVNKLVGDTTEFVRSGWTNAYGSHVQIDGGGMTVNYGNWYTRFDGNGMTFKDGGDSLGGFTRIGMTGAPDWYNGLAFNAGGDAEFLSIGAQDYGNDNQNPVPAKLLWMRSFDDKNRYGYQPGWNFCDTVWADDLKLNHIGTSSYRLDLVALSMNGETAFGLQSGNGYGFWWGANGGLGIYGGGKYVNFTHTKFINDIQMGQGGSINWSSL